MIANLFCKSVIPWPKLYRPFVHHAEKIRDASVSIGRSKYDPVGRIYYPRVYVHGRGPIPTYALNEFLRRRLKSELAPQIAEPFLAQFVVRGVVPNLYTFSLMTKSYCKQLRYQRVLHAVLTQMKALGIEGSNSFYENLVRRVSTSFGPVVTYDLLKKMRTSHRVEMPLSCYNALVPQFIKRKHVYRMSIGMVFVKLMNHMKRHRVFPDQSLIDVFLKARYIYNGHFKRAEGIARQMMAEGIKVGAVQHVER